MKGMKRLITVVCAVLLAGCAEREGTPSGRDTTGPFINISKYVFDTTVGNEIDFSYITGYDDVDGLVPVQVLGTIDYSKPGEYYPVLSAVDYSNNETLVGIVVIVHEEDGTQTVPEPEQKPEIPQETGCTAPGALREDIPCGVVPPETAQVYDMLFPGEGGEERCEAWEAGSCEAVYTNDGSFWGYGLIKEE